MQAVEFMLMSRPEKCGSFGTRGIDNRISNWKNLSWCMPITTVLKREEGLLVCPQPELHNKVQASKHQN